jgi:2-(1,2-epoxy-1,2-dihydrophenyl)acetyl-CoA isomerase
MTIYRELRESGAEETRELVTVERRGERAIVTMDEPERLNPLSVGLNLQLQERLSELAADPAVRAIVLTGADPAFSTGGDLEMMATGNRAIRDPGTRSDTTDAWRWIRHQFGGVARLIATTDKLFVAALNGPAAGVGLAWARAACDASWEQSLRLEEFAEANCFSTAALGDAAQSLLEADGSGGREETE